MGLKLLVFVGAVVLLIAMFSEWDTFKPEFIRGKRVLITGASSGIGEELAYQYSKSGAAVVITARRKELLQKVASKCKLLGADKVEYIVADMASHEDRQKVAIVTEKLLGGLDHLILNHDYSTLGLWLGTPENMTKVSLHLEINFVSYVDIASRCLKMLTESKGNIGVVSSIFGKLPSVMGTTHSTSKYALQGFFSSLRQELKLKNMGVSVTNFVLGYIATDKAMEVMDEAFNKDKVSFLNPAAVNETATAIIKAIVKRKREMYFPKHAWYIVTAHKFFPEYVDYFLANILFDAAKDASQSSP